MSAALLLITHEHIAEDLLSTAHNILKNPIGNISAIEIPMDASVEYITDSINTQLATLDTHDGILILTDLVGSTPFNVATQIKEGHANSYLISGLNLPMLLKLSNYRELPLNELADKAIIGGQSGINLYE